MKGGKNRVTLGSLPSVQGRNPTEQWQRSGQQCCLKGRTAHSKDGDLNPTLASLAKGACFESGNEEMGIECSGTPSRF